MCESGSKFDAEDLHQNIVANMLHEKARVEFIKQGGRNLRDEDDVLDLLEKIQEELRQMQIKHANRHRNINNFKNTDGANTHDNNDKNKNWCFKNGHNHLWSNCPDNPNSYKGDGSRQRGDARSRDGSGDDGGRHERHRHNNNDENRD